MSEKRFEWSRKRDWSHVPDVQRTELRKRYPNLYPERTVQGTAHVDTEGVRIEPSDETEHHGGTILPKDALELASEILRVHRPHGNVPISLLLVCVECGTVCEAPWHPGDLDGFTRTLYEKRRWYLSVVSPPGSGEIRLAPVCPICIVKVMPPEVIAAFKKNYAQPKGTAPVSDDNTEVSKLDDRYAKKDKPS